MTTTSRTAAVWRSALCAIAIVVLLAFVYWPGVGGFWGRDDFAVLAFVRLLDTPWPLFVHDHFPVPGSVFRPLGFAAWWLCERLFGSDYQMQAIAGLALHAAVCLALFSLLRRLQIHNVVALLCTLLFALHPAVIGTTLWWSARCDPLSTLFVLLALQAALAYRQQGRRVALIVALVAALAAMFTKEIGLIAVAAMSLLWLRWAWHEPMHRAKALRAIALACTCGLVFLIWRWAVLGTLSSGMTAMVPIQNAMARGLLAWCQQAPGYLVFWARLGWFERMALGASLLVAVVATTMALLRLRPRSGTGLYFDMALCGLCLWLLPALLQAPIAAFALPLSAGNSAVETAMQSRLYYLGLAGATIMLATVMSTCWNGSTSGLRLACVIPVAVAAAVFALVSRDLAQAFAQRSFAISAVAREAVAAVGGIELPPAPCHVMFLDVEPPPEWNTYVSMDSIVKALSPDLDRVKACWFHDNYGAAMNLQFAPASAADAVPYAPLQVNGQPLPWRTLGGVVIAYLQPPQDVSLDQLARMKFLRRRDGHFDDVSANVAAGMIAVHLD